MVWMMAALQIAQLPLLAAEISLASLDIPFGEEQEQTIVVFQISKSHAKAISQ